MEAIHELRRVSGTQLDETVVEALISIVGRDVSFRHGEDADFGAELASRRAFPSSRSSLTLSRSYPEEPLIIFVLEASHRRARLKAYGPR